MGFIKNGFILAYDRDGYIQLRLKYKKETLQLES